VDKKTSMAKKTMKKKTLKETENFWESMRFIASNERVRFLTGLLINFLVIYAGVALISFFFTGGSDQSAISNLSAGDLLAGRGRVENWAGIRGAYIADLMMNRWFGISSFFLLFFVGSLGSKLMGLCKLSLI
jgi:S-DNA-T family DNA segregation ATPase FtsK/SpoIIIE